jgi:hypothetical protein
LRGCLADDSIVIVDDAANEITDIIANEPTSSRITFLHCKYSGEDDPGNRVGDWYELFAQCARSHAWIRKANLLIELDRRLDSRQNTHIVADMGIREDLRNLARNNT